MLPWSVPLGAAAVTLIVTLGSIFDGLRERGPSLWRELWHCPLCCGWWFGAFAAVLHGSLGLPAHLAAWQIVTTGAYSGVLALFGRRVLDWLDGNTP